MEAQGAIKGAAGVGLKLILKKLGLPALLIVFLIILPLVFIPIFFFMGDESGVSGGDPSEVALKEIPKKFMPIYEAAASKYGVPWNLLAAHHRVETNFSDSGGISSSVGAIGPMQFMPCTWIGWSYPGCSGLGFIGKIITKPSLIAKYGGYGVDGNGDGKANPKNIVDAIFSAANYLSANGASDGHIKDAIFAYNHSPEYVDKVLHYANVYTENGAVPVGQFLWPVPFTHNLTSQFGFRSEPRTEFHSGIDISAAGIFGEPVLSIDNGKVIRAGFIGGYGKAVIIQHSEHLEATYGHLSSISVKTGQTVRPGQKIGNVGSTGDSTGPHLHLTIKIEGELIDPMTLFTN